MPNRLREELQNLIAEKKRTEDALNDLRTTQSPTHQAEKWASLGQLTAASRMKFRTHLNFVK
jgi:C4-dicarboxylate-specific signal transduction histidine kinase